MVNVTRIMPNETTRVKVGHVLRTPKRVTVELDAIDRNLLGVKGEMQKAREDFISTLIAQQRGILKIGKKVGGKKK